MKKLLLIIFILLNAAALQAIYVENYPVTLEQPDGTKVSCFLSGDEYYNWVHDANGYSLIRDAQGYIVYAKLENDELVATSYRAGSVDPSAVGLQPNQIISDAKRTLLRSNFLQRTAAAKNAAGLQDEPPSPVYAPRTGTLNNIVIYISFHDSTDFHHTTTQVENFFTNPTRGQSLLSYYRDISNNTFNIPSTFYPAPAGTTILSYQAPNNRSYYEIDNNNNAGRLIEHGLLRDAVNYCKTAIEATLTATDLDYDNNGTVDNICFVIQGTQGAWSTLLWPHRWSLYSYTLYLHGNKRVYDYNLILENHLFTESNGKQSVLVHETYHTLSAPDLYRYSGNFVPVGKWDVMASNTVPPQSSSAYVSNKYGKFLSDGEIVEITTSGTYTLYDIWDKTSTHAKAYKIATSKPNEWIYLEYRKKTGETHETDIPDEGIIIYRVNTSVGNSGNANGPPDEIYVYRPGASNNTTNGTIASANFSSQTGRTTFSATSNPPCFLSDNSVYDNFVIKNISASGGTTMTFNVFFNQTITWTQTLNATYGSSPVTLTATASSGLAVSYSSSNPAVATVSGNTLNIIGIGTATITASQAGNADYNAATPINKTLTVSKGNQTITWTQELNATYGDSPVTLSATASSGLAVTYSSGNTSVATVSGNTLTIVDVGTATITASQAGNANYNPISANKLLTVNKISETITFNPVTSVDLTQGSYTLAASTQNGFTVKFRIDGSIAVASLDAVNNTLLHLHQSGDVTVTAYIDESYYAAPEVSRTITVLSDNTDLGSVSVSNSFETQTDYYVANCGENGVTITIIPAEAGAKVVYNGVENNEIILDVSHADIYDINYEIQANAGNKTQYSLKVESKFDFYDIASAKFNNILFVNNNSNNNGGYKFKDYQWFKNGQSIGTGQYYSAGNSRNDLLDATAQYSVTLTTTDLKVLHTCPGTVTLQTSAASAVQAYPNPAHKGEQIILRYIAPEIPENTMIRIYNISGKLVDTQKLAGSETKLSLPPISGMYLITVGNESIKIIVE